MLSKQPWLSYLELAVKVKQLLSIKILNTLKSTIIIAELRHVVAISIKVCSAKRA